MREKFHASLLLCAVALVVLMAETAEAQTIRIGGSGFALGVMKILGQSFEQSHRGTKVEVVPSLGSTGGIKALLGGSIDIAVSGRRPEQEEVNRGAAGFKLARSPFVFVTGKSVSKSGLTLAEVEKIYRGQLQTWPDQTRIRVVLRPENDTTTKTLRAISPGMDGAVTVAMARPGMIRVVTDQENAGTVEKTPGGLGVGSLTQMYSEQRQVKILSVDGVEPTLKTLRNGSYPLSVPLYLVTATRATPDVQRFLEFVSSRTGRNILHDYGCLSEQRHE